MKKLLILFCIFVVLVMGCTTTPTVEEKTNTNDITAQASLPPEVRTHIIAQCMELCNAAKKQGEKLSAGPCLSDGTPFVEDWVCDSAHYPRQPIDDKPENQCADFIRGKANHFVEVDENCNLIKRH